MKQMSLALILLSTLLIPPCVRAQTQTAAARDQRLITAKTVYVEPMPGGLDQWITQDLRAWGKYRITASSQGVDLLILAKKPVNKDLYKQHGVVPGIRRSQKMLPVLSVTVINWVTRERLWQADILNKAAKKDQPPSPPSPRMEIDARHMKPAEIAERCTNALRRYVESIEQSSPPTPAKP